MASVAEKRRDIVISYLNAPTRHYNCERVTDTYKKKFYHQVSDAQLALYAYDRVGMNSDCFILYAIAMLGATGVEGIRLFLKALAEKEKGLSIIDCSTKEPLLLRLDILLKNGFIFRHLYEYPYANSQNEECYGMAAIYTLSNSAHDFMNQHLQKKVICNNWMAAKPITELVGIASCGFVSGIVANKCNKLLEQKQGVIKTKAIGVYIIPSVLKMAAGDDNVYMGFIPSYLKRDTAIMTENDYEERCIRLVNVIKQYFFSYDQRNKKSGMVVVVEDAQDLANVTSWISRTKILDDDYSRIYFTGEGVFSGLDTDKTQCHFLQMKKARTEAGYTLVSAELPGMGK